MMQEDLTDSTAYNSLSKGLNRKSITRLVQISLRHKYVYFAIPKNASSTIKYYLQNIEFEGTPFKASRNPHDRASSPLIAAYQLPADLFQEVMSSNEYRRFVVIRHPVSRLLSCYLDRIQMPHTLARRRVGKWLDLEDDAEISLEQFVSAICAHEDRELESHFKLQTDFIGYPDIPITHFVRFERLREEFPELLVKLGMKKIPSMEENLSPPATGANEKIRQHYNSKLLSIVQERYKRDMQAFGYDPIEL
jgi:hypothetical protein